MSGGFFRGTSAEQDTRFSNKAAKLLKTQKFASELDEPIDMSKVNMEVMRPWIATRVTELLGGFEDEVLINFIYELLDVKVGDGKHIQIQLTGFMEKNTGRFMKELWSLLSSAQANANGIPQVFLEKKAAETQMKKAEEQRILSAIQQTMERDKGAEPEQQAKSHDQLNGSGAKDPSSVKESSAPQNELEVKKVASPGRKRSPSRSSSSRSRSRSPRSRRRSHRSPPRRRSPLPPSRRRRLSRSRSPKRGSPPRRRHSPPLPKRRHDSRSRTPPRRRSRTPPRRRSPPPHRRRTSRSRSPRPISPRRGRHSRSPRHRIPSPPRRHRRSPRRPSPHQRHSPPHRRQRSPPPKPRRRSPSPDSPRSPASPARGKSKSPGRKSRSRQASPERERSPVRSPSRDGDSGDEGRKLIKRNLSSSPELKTREAVVESNVTGGKDSDSVEAGAAPEASASKPATEEVSPSSEDKRESKKRRKEEKKQRKEEKRMRREEKRKRKEEKRNKKSGASSSVNGTGGVESSRPAESGDLAESERKRIEEDLRKKVVESLKAKKVNTE